MRSVTMDSNVAEAAEHTAHSNYLDRTQQQPPGFLRTRNSKAHRAIRQIWTIGTQT
jgi:hypothetical protein